MKSALRKAIQVVSVTLLIGLVSMLSSPPSTFAQHSDTQQISIMTSVPAMSAFPAAIWLPAKP
ncbi:MAG: hypothetical protein ICV76_05680 [Nitrospiraceae bacterium]|nr:hypothetical protein [Nitrospiraceae bacterium]